MNSGAARAWGAWLVVIALVTSLVISSPSAAAQDGEPEPTVDISGNQLSGPMPEGINFTGILDLRDNQLSGTLPALAGRIFRLRLAGNLLTGDLTVGLAGVIDDLSLLDLSDGAGGNDCFTITDSAILDRVAELDANWDECEQ